MDSINLKIVGIKRATVVDNVDPLQSGRIKVLVHEYMENVDTASIPWAKPLWSSIVGGSVESAGYFAVPDMQSQVYVMFENGDPLAPIYIGSATDNVHGQPAFAKGEDYPNIKGIRFNNGVEFFVNQAKDIIRINHPSGTFIEVDATGKVRVDSPDTIHLEAVNININANMLYSTVTGDVNIDVTGNVNLDATGTVDINASQVTMN